MNKNILNTGVQEFLNKNLNTDISSVLFKSQLFEGISNKEVAEQIEAKAKCKEKLPTWFNMQQIIYPNKLNIEQTSSEITARYKADLIHGNILIDLTGGFGVDSYFFSQKCNVIHCEINRELSELAAHNFKVLGKNNITTVAQNGLDYLQESGLKFDWVYIDPSRRHDKKGKVFLLADCLPDVTLHLDLLFEKSKNILIKTSPLLDLSNGIKELNFVKEIHVVAVENDVKELLWVLEKNFGDGIRIKTANLKKGDSHYFEFELKSEQINNGSYELPQTYLYEPNSAILKSGGFQEVSNQLNISKLHQHSHLYTSEKLIDFPGRRFKIETIIPFNKKELKVLNIHKANITTRNFPESVANLRKKLKIKDGGDTYLFFTTDMNNQKIVLICSKVQS